jgi:MFS family permease
LKNLRSILLLFGANTISSVAQGISMLAIPWYFVQRGETQLLVQIYLITTIFTLFWGLLCGTIVDKYNRKHIFLVLVSTVGLLIAAISAYGFYNGGLSWHFAALAFAATFLNYNLHYPNLYAFLQEISEKKQYAKMTSYVEIQGQVALMMAGAGAAMLLEGIDNGELELFGTIVNAPFSIPKWELHEILALDAATYFVSFILISMMRYKPIAKRNVEVGNLVERFKTGFAFLKQNPKTFVFGTASYMIFATLLICSMNIFPIYVKNHLYEPANTYAMGKMFYTLGALISGIAIHTIFKHFSRSLAIILLTFITAALYITLASTAIPMIFFIVSLLLGLANSGTRILRMTYLFQVIPNQVFGRAGSIFFISNVLFRLIFLSIFTIPFFHASNNVIYTFVIFTIFLVVAGSVLIWNERRKI